MLVVGEGKKGLLVNTTWDEQRWADDKATKGITFANAAYGLRILGPKLPKGATFARLEVLSETLATVRVRVTCVVPAPGAAYRIERRAGFESAPAASVPGPSAIVDLDATKIARFRCAPT